MIRIIVRCAAIVLACVTLWWLRDLATVAPGTAVSLSVLMGVAAAVPVRIRLRIELRDPFAKRRNGGGA